MSAELDTGTYPTGTKITDRQMNDLQRQGLRLHDFHGEWNYTPIPQTQPNPACY